MKRKTDNRSIAREMVADAEAEQLARNIETYGPEFAARLADWNAGGPELTEEESARFREGLDFDEVVVGAYIDGRLPDDVAEAVEIRLRRDDVFRKNYGTFIKISMNTDFMSMVAALLRERHDERV